jgi:hypothetical protein
MRKAGVQETGWSGPWTGRASGATVDRPMADDGTFRWLEETIDFLRPQLRANYERQKQLGLLRDE